MKLAVITPVGPGHERLARRASESVIDARRNRVGFQEVRHILVRDVSGDLGRSRARNLGMDLAADADWYFFLDADDRVRPDAFAHCDFDRQATFGAVRLDGQRRCKNVWPCGWREIALYGAAGTLAMGFFCRADVARRLRYDETMDAGEDFDFYMRLDDFTKVEQPLVDIGYDQPSAGGPRGYERIDWVGICNGAVAKAVEREPARYDLGHHAVLAKATNLRGWPGDVP